MSPAGSGSLVAQKLRVLVLLITVFARVCAEIEPVNGVIPPSSNTVEMKEAIIHGPGYVDLSGLLFETAADGGGKNSTILDIAVFRMSKKSCGLSCEGIGAESTFGYAVCCSEEAMILGLCDRSKYGRLIYDKDKFKGTSRYITVPAQGASSQHLEDDGKIKLYASGVYALLLANCDDAQGRVVTLKGELAWKSAHGFLPGEMFGIMDSLILFTCGYIVLLLWYAHNMYVYRESRIPVEEWILGTIIIGFLAVAFDMGQFSSLNRSGRRNFTLAMLSLLFGCFRQVLTRCMALLLAMGAGMTVTETVDWRPVMRFGMVYLVLGLLMDSGVAYVVKTFRTHTYEQEKPVIEFSHVIFFILVLLDFFVFVWMIWAVNKTISFLSITSRVDIQQRYVHLRTVFIAVVIAALCLCGLSFVHKSVLYARRYTWILNILVETVYLGVYTNVALLWKPRPDAKNYAPLAQSPGEEVEEEEGDLYLELTDAGPAPTVGGSPAAVNPISA